MSLYELMIRRKVAQPRRGYFLVQHMCERMVEEEQRGLSD